MLIFWNFTWSCAERKSTALGTHASLVWSSRENKSEHHKDGEKQKRNEREKKKIKKKYDSYSFEQLQGSCSFLPSWFVLVIGKKTCGNNPIRRFVFAPRQGPTAKCPIL